MDTSALLTANKEGLEKLFSRMGEFEVRLQRATGAPAPVHSDLKTLASEYADFKSFVCQALTTLTAQTNLLSIGLERHETFLRRKVLLFHGVAETKEEKLADVISKVISDQMNLDLTNMDLRACHRLGSSSAKTRPILVRFRDLDHRREVWDAKTTLKNSGVVISEFLTKSRHDVFVAARKYYGVKNVWTSEGNIHLILPDKSRRRIEVMDDLEKCKRSHPVSPSANVNPTAPSASPSGSTTSSAQTSAAKVAPPAQPKQTKAPAQQTTTNASHGKRAAAKK
ncbi:hypothetical protein NE865_04710 [Phthorimaea operculella]|nr:hypothetical protein NE865_04710 [Phthorimaea operculella]